MFIDGIFRAGGAEAEAARPVKRAVANERERSAGNAVFVHDCGDEALEFGGELVFRLSIEGGFASVNGRPGAEVGEEN